MSANYFVMMTTAAMNGEEKVFKTLFEEVELPDAKEALVCSIAVLTGLLEAVSEKFDDPEMGQRFWQDLCLRQSK